MSAKKLSREAIARIEIGSTDISRGLSVFLLLVFVLAIFSVPVAQYFLDRGKPAIVFENIYSASASGVIESIDQRNKHILKNIDILETELEERSFLRKLFLPPLQYIQARFLQQGNEKVVVGKDGELFYRPSVEYLFGQPFLDENQQFLRRQSHELWEKEVAPDPVTAITTFRDQLNQKGIELIIMPVPVKPGIRPAALTGKSFREPLANRSWGDFLRLVEEAGVPVFDIREILSDSERQNGASYLQTDTHWTPASMSVVASALGGYLLEEFPELQGKENYQALPMEIEGSGDISRMMTLPSGSGLYPPVNIQIEQILTETGEYWQPDRHSPVLLLGDSFTNIYSAATLDWGTGAGLAEHLSLSLGRSVDLIARNDSGAYATREILSQELQRGRDRLEGKKIVVWEFAERELAFGDWKYLPLELGASSEKSFVILEGDDTLVVQATVKSISRSPRPGSVPYRDNLITLHLVDLEGEGVEAETNQALVYALGMKDNALTGFAHVRPGDSLTLVLSSWDKKELQYGSIRRTPLDDEMLELELPNWGELHEK